MNALFLEEYWRRWWRNKKVPYCFSFWKCLDYTIETHRSFSGQCYSLIGLTLRSKKKKISTLRYGQDLKYYSFTLTSFNMITKFYILSIIRFKCYNFAWKEKKGKLIKLLEAISSNSKCTNIKLWTHLNRVIFKVTVYPCWLNYLTRIIQRYNLCCLPKDLIRHTEETHCHLEEL